MSNKDANARFMLAEAVETYGLVDVGKGAEKVLGISREKLRNLLKDLIEKGYQVVPVLLERDDARVVVKVLARPEYTYQSIKESSDQIHKLKGDA